MRVSAIELYKDYVKKILGVLPTFTEDDFGSFWEGGYGNFRYDGYRFTYSSNTFLVCWDSFLQEFFLYQISLHKRWLFGRNKVWIKKIVIRNVLDII